MIKFRIKAITAIFICFSVIILGIIWGSVELSGTDIIRIFIYKLFGTPLPENIKSTTVTILWNFRIPRILSAFIAGGALAVSGSVMQSVLRNPLASSYTLGVSSGASFGACLVIIYGVTIPIISFLTLPITGFLFGLGTIFLIISFSCKINKQTMNNNTIILAGMVFSLFINALTTLFSALSKDGIQKLIYWQMGSFSMIDWTSVLILTPIIFIGLIILIRHHYELDIMTFGEESARVIGINLKRTKLILLITASALTGAVISFVGVIGFVDLVAPHIVRRIFGVPHKYVIPFSVLFGGAFMVTCDLIARTVISPSELPVGAVTAIIGAPFFAYIYFKKH